MSLDSLSHGTMEEIREDEEKWLKFFTKKSLIGCVIGAIPGYLVFALVGTFAPAWVGGILWLIIEAAFFAVTTLKLSVEDNRNSGGGQYLYMVLLMKVFHKFNREVYVKMNRNEEDENV